MLKKGSIFHWVCRCKLKFSCTLLKKKLFLIFENANYVIFSLVCVFEEIIIIKIHSWYKVRIAHSACIHYSNGHAGRISPKFLVGFKFTNNHKIILKSTKLKDYIKITKMSMRVNSCIKIDSSFFIWLESHFTTCRRHYQCHLNLLKYIWT